MRVKSIFAALLMIVAGVQTVKAQKVTISFDDDQVVEYDVSHIKSMTFEEAEINTKIDDIYNYLAQQITGIIIQDTENPLFGSFNLSANSQSKLLIAFYGRPANEIEFPTTDYIHYLKKSEALTEEDWSMLDGIEVFTQDAYMPLVNEAENGKAYAGKVYVTINPSSLDATGLELQIVNSQDDESPIRLSPLRRSDTILKNRRARGSGNGFYEATAYVNVNKYDIEEFEFPIEEVYYMMSSDIREKIAEIAQNLDYYFNQAVSLYPMANDIYQFICGTPLIQSLIQNLERNALKCPFKDTSGKDQAVYSSYNLITTLFQPLGMATDMEWFEENYPGEDFFGPFMYACDRRGTKLLSEEKAFPAVFTADEFTLYPTTKTMELVVPIARKHIAITDVFKGGKSAKGGDADCLSHLREANASDMLNSVIDGTVREIEVTNMSPGYLYEIAYSVLDFDGNIATRKYYVQIR